VLLLAASTTLAVLCIAPADATVFYAREELLDIAFPDADSVEARDFFLTDQQRSTIERRASARLESNLVTVYIGFKDEALLGYALIDTHLVRTLPETFLVVLEPDGAVAATHVVAFYEPLEYLPSGRWLEQLEGKALTTDLRVGRRINAITGSTLSSRAVVGGVRRALALHDVLIARASR